jgi:hypothetical protein
MNMPRDPYYTTAFGASVDQEIADAMRAGMAIELIYAELSARTRAVADQIVANHTRRDFSEATT